MVSRAHQNTFFIHIPIPPLIHQSCVYTICSYLYSTFRVDDPSSLATSTVLSTSSATLASTTFRESCTSSVTSTCQSGPSIVIIWFVPSLEVVWNWVRTLTWALWYCSVHPLLTLRSSSSSSSLSMAVLRR